MNLSVLKKGLLLKYHNYLQPAAGRIARSPATHQEKSQEVNALITDYQKTLASSLPTFQNAHAKQQAYLVLSYCTCAVSLEYRHRVWPYEYMALSRRVGELWERFCSTAWDYPSREQVTRIPPPSFAEVSQRLRSEITNRAIGPDSRKDIETKLDVLFDLIGNINMKEDETFTVKGVPYVIDFKSGFGSNEKGNTFRLMTVGRAYKLWNTKTKLLLLVRQGQNNNYLNVIRRSGLWDVRCGSEAYATIDELTGSDLEEIRRSVIDFRSDLSKTCWSDLCAHLSNLTNYLQW